MDIGTFGLEEDIYRCPKCLCVPCFLMVQNIVSLSFKNAFKQIHTLLPSRILNGLAVSEIPVSSEGI